MAGHSDWRRSDSAGSLPVRLGLARAASWNQNAVAGVPWQPEWPPRRRWPRRRAPGRGRAASAASLRPTGTVQVTVTRTDSARRSGQTGTVPLYWSEPGPWHSDSYFANKSRASESRSPAAGDSNSRTRSTSPSPSPVRLSRRTQSESDTQAENLECRGPAWPVTVNGCRRSQSRVCRRARAT